MRTIAVMWSVVLMLGGCAMAQEAPTAPEAPASDDAPAEAPPAVAAPDADPRIDQLLDTLDARGKDLDSFIAKVSLREADAGLGSSITSRGTVRYQRTSEEEARIRVDFSEREEEGQRLAEQRVYVLENGQLVERDYESRRQITRQVLRPGEKLNLLRLGEGPFPLPIGQAKEDVHRMFEVSLMPAEKTDPPNTTRLRLVPRPGTRFEQQFTRIDVWVDEQTHMPRRIRTMDANEVTLRTTELSDVQINAALRDADFRLERVDPRRWNLIDEGYPG